MHIHVIDADEHREFLAQERQDPITGDRIKAGDAVVFCAACKSVFLHETWDYLGNQHCEQSQTLAQVPSSEKIAIRSKTNHELKNSLHKYRVMVGLHKPYIPSEMDFLTLGIFGGIGVLFQTYVVPHYVELPGALFMLSLLMVITVLPFVFFFLQSLGLPPVSTLFRSRMGKLEVAENGFAVSSILGGKHVLLMPRILQVKIRHLFGIYFSVSFFTQESNRVKRRRIYILLRDYEEAKEFFSLLVETSQQVETGIVAIKKLPMYGSYELSGHIYYLNNYRGAKFIDLPAWSL
jgi:hypothetical protein